MIKLSDIFEKLKKSKNTPKTSTDKINSRYFIKIWKKFIRQIPREFRFIHKSHKHFILIGNSNSGKSDLVHSIVEQSQNVYPFEVEYAENKDIQFYLGPHQIIQELSLEVIKNRTIKLRKALIRLWKQLFAKAPPIIVIAHNCWLGTSTNVHEVNKFARLIGGKLSLLSKLTKSSLKVRVNLTHFDKLEGYLEFAHFLKQHNLAFKIPLTTNFQSEVLSSSLIDFRKKYLSLILTSTSTSDYQKILVFLSELPKLFPLIEEFLRAVTAGHFSHDLDLEFLSFSSNQDPYTSFVSFDWKEEKESSIFFRHPMLKHQIAAAGIAVVGMGLIINNYAKDAQQITLYRKGIDSLLFSQPKLFIDELVPEIEQVNTYRPQECYLPILPRFFKKELLETNQSLSDRIKKHIFEPILRRFMLQEVSEIKIIYMLGLMHATKENRLGQHILNNLESWSDQLQLDKRLIRSFIRSTLHLNKNPFHIDYLDKLNISTLLSDIKLWQAFLCQFKGIIEQPVFTGHNFEEIRTAASHSLQQLRTLKEDRNVFVISNLLKETENKYLTGFEKNIKVLKWIEENSDTLESFLLFIYQSCPAIPEVEDLNISQFFVKLKEVANLTLNENRLFHFLIEDETFSFETKQWSTLSATHVIERLIQKYIVANHDTQGNIFFKNMPEISSLEFESHRNEFPFFPKSFIINGRFTRIAFEKNVRNTTESLLKLLGEMPIIEEDRARFKKFVHQEVISYAKEYQESYERLYGACDIHTNTLEEIKDLLAKILVPSSYLEYFLQTVTHHTEIFSDPTTSLNVLYEINHFHFLPRLMNQIKQNKSPFQKYQVIIQNVLAELNQSQAPEGLSSPLTPFLTPAANISLAILKNDPLSYVNQIQSTLTEIGVPENYHFLFIAPITRIYALGMKDLKVGIQRLWQTNLYPQISNLFQKRPFNPTGKEVATLEEVKQLTNPKSDFFGIVKDIISPLSISQEGYWTPQSEAVIQLDQAIYTLFNRLAKISHFLWDTQGNPKSLEVTIQSLPFETKDKVFPAPIISYLVTGDETFHNFNQNPMWHSMKIEWWKPNSSIVVMEFANKKGSRSYRDEKITNTLWSFFELLRKAKQSKENVWEWELASQFGDEISHVALEFQTNPWDFFQ